VWQTQAAFDAKVGLIAQFLVPHGILPSGRLKDQCLKWRMPVKTIASWCSLAASMTS
jgi:hypothetical protein